MDRARARQLAEQCFRLARSTTFAGERDAAIGRGTAIVNRAGLDLDEFDIPGRTARRRPATTGACTAAPTSYGFRRYAAPERYSREDIRDIMETFRRQETEALSKSMADLYATMERRRTETGATDDETPFDAARRNFDQACRAAKERDAARERAA